MGEHMVFIISHSVMVQRTATDLLYLQNMNIGLVIAADLTTYVLLLISTYNMLIALRDRERKNPNTEEIRFHQLNLELVNRCLAFQ